MAVRIHFSRIRKFVSHVPGSIFANYANVLSANVGFGTSRNYVLHTGQSIVRLSFSIPVVWVSNGRCIQGPD